MSSSSAGRGAEYGVQHLVCDRKCSLHEFISTLCGQDRAQELIELGAIYINEVRATAPSMELNLGDKVRVHSSPRRFAIPQDMKERIVQSTEDYIVIDKPPGIPVHALVDNSRENLLAALETQLGHRFFITHRLDVETSGLLVFALSPDAQARLNRGFANGEIKRVYNAVVESPLEPGIYTHYMQPSPKTPKIVSTTPHMDWLRCDLKVLSCAQIHSERGLVTTSQTCWALEPEASEIYEVNIELLTGRTHQIRSQLAALGSPILGDVRYGSAYTVFDANQTKAIALRAFQIKFS